MNLKIIVISLTAGILLLLGYYLGWDYLKPAPEPILCTEDAMQCPDGSYVGRTGPKCEFSACPRLKSDFNQIDTSEWKIYRNEKYGFLVKYPVDWIVLNEGISAGLDYEHVAKFTVPGWKLPSITITVFSQTNNIPTLEILHKYDKSLQSGTSIELNGVKMAVYGSFAEEFGTEGVVFRSNNVLVYIHEFGIGTSKKYLNQILSTFKFVD